MAKRDAEIEPLDEELVEAEPPTVGERLRAAREEKKLSLEDVAAQTRIPQRHLASIETAEWDSLPAPTYTIGFAKNYAGGRRPRPHRDRQPAARGNGRPALRDDLRPMCSSLPIRRGPCPSRW